MDQLAQKLTPLIEAIGTDILLNEKDVADFLKVSPRTLQAWRLRGGGPPYLNITARLIRYSAKALTLWIIQRERRSTSDQGLGAYDG